MRRNKTEIKTAEEGPVLLAGKREPPAQPNEEVRTAGFCEQLAVLNVVVIVAVMFIYSVAPKPSEPAAGDTGPVVHPREVPGLIGSIGPEDHTSELLCCFKRLQFRFAVITNLVYTKNVDEEKLTQLKIEMDRLKNVLDKTQPRERLSDKHRAILTEQFNKVEGQFERMEKELGISD